MPSPWTQRMVRETPPTQYLGTVRRERCNYRAMPGRAFDQCKRSGTVVVIVDDERATRPLCWQHGRKVEDMHTAAAIGTDRIVRLKVIK